jgi:hypothetical protein
MDLEAGCPWNDTMYPDISPGIWPGRKPSAFSYTRKRLSHSKLPPYTLQLSVGTVAANLIAVCFVPELLHLPLPVYDLEVATSHSIAVAA